MSGLILATAAPETPSLIAHFGITALLAGVPFVAIAGTAFIKIVIVLFFLRLALGAQGIPPNSVLNALAAVLSIFVMAPVGAEIADTLRAAAPALPTNGDPLGVSEAQALYEIVSPPLIDFLNANAPKSEIEYFVSLANTIHHGDPGLLTLLPAFAVGEIGNAFIIGLLIFIPFSVVDLIVANTLVALGLHMLPPTAVSLPLKLLLFIALDGWHILLTGLLVNYSP